MLILNPNMVVVGNTSPSPEQMKSLQKDANFYLNTTKGSSPAKIGGLIFATDDHPNWRRRVQVQEVTRIGKVRVYKKG